MTRFLTIIISLFGSFSLFAEEIASGTFTGKSDHVTTGSVTITKTDDGYAIVLGKDFRLDGAPDPRVGLGKDGYESSTDVGALRENEGEQSYPLAKSVDPAEFNEVWIWCRRFNVPFGVAKLASE
ncbi:MAG: DM13 domain-containing protein [Verrucomicrobiota bacterium]